MSARVLDGFVRQACCTLLLLAGAVGVVSCAAPAQENPARAAEGFLHAMGAQDLDALCKMVVDDSGQPLEAGSPDFAQCKQVLGWVMGFQSAADRAWSQEATVAEAIVHGDTATIPDSALSPSPPGSWKADDFTLQRVDGRWYVDLDD